MVKKEDKHRYITVNLDEHRPQVVLFGNGLNWQEEFKWSEVLDGIQRPGYDAAKYDDLQKIPNNLKASLSADVDDKEFCQKLTKSLETYEYKDLNLLKMILDLNADAYLTTNYTYDLEECIVKGISKYSADRFRKFRYYIKNVKANKSNNERYLLHTYNKMNSNGKPIWHIHGELKRPQSMVLSLDKYVRLIGEMISHNKDSRNKYAKFSSDLRITSWMDYFIVADVYILGFGFDFSEFDLWWLLGRRLREKGNKGNIYFFCDKNSKSNIANALGDMGVNIEYFEVKGSNYTSAYKQSINRINEFMKLNG